MKETKPKSVIFRGRELQNAFEKLESGAFDEQQLFKWISTAIRVLNENPKKGIKIQRHLWPPEYTRNRDINNLWKYNLPKGWRLTYTIIEDEIEIMSIILEWMNHTKYERRFKY